MVYRQWPLDAIDAVSRVNSGVGQRRQGFESTRALREQLAGRARRLKVSPQQRLEAAKLWGRVSDFARKSTAEPRSVRCLQDDSGVMPRPVRSVRFSPALSPVPSCNVAAMSPPAKDSESADISSQPSAGPSVDLPSFGLFRADPMLENAAIQPRQQHVPALEQTECGLPSSLQHPLPWNGVLRARVWFTPSQAAARTAASPPVTDSAVRCLPEAERIASAAQGLQAASVHPATMLRGRRSAKAKFLPRDSSSSETGTGGESDSDSSSDGGVRRTGESGAAAGDEASRRTSGTWRPRLRHRRGGWTDSDESSSGDDWDRTRALRHRARSRQAGSGGARDSASDGSEESCGDGQGEQASAETQDELAVLIRLSTSCGLRAFCQR